MERQLMAKLEEMGLGAIRVAGSGGPDVVTAVGGRTLFLECKYSTKESVYVPKEEVERECRLADRMGATFLLAIKFSRKGWRLIGRGRLPEFATPKSYVFRLRDMGSLPGLPSILDNNLNDYDKNRSGSG